MPSAAHAILSSTRDLDGLTVERRSDRFAPDIRPHQADAAGFISALERAKAKRSAKEEATDAAREFVAIALVQPALKHMRESGWAAPPFAPSDGERKFAGLLDAEIAQRVVRSANFPIVDRVAEGLLSHGRGRPAGAHGDAAQGPIVLRGGPTHG